MPTVDGLEGALKGHCDSVSAALATATRETLSRLRAQYIGRDGIVRQLFQKLSDYTFEDRPRVGQLLNKAKADWTKLFDDAESRLAQPRPTASVDLTLPGHPPALGHRHPISQVIDEILGVFERLGFAVVEGPEIETPFHNFDALNIPPEHPSRESFDTFFLWPAGRGAADSTGGGRNSPTADERLLRSHTSPVQVRYLEHHADRPRPFRIVVPGRVFRPDALDASHCFQFHQIEGLVVEPGVTLADLKGLLTAFAQAVFGPATRLRFRPHFFPFTEPSAEADISCIFCRGHGCRVCGQKGWLEILGAGMVHPHVFAATGWPSTSRGLAFGLGVERIAMLKHGIDDIRLFFDNDVRFLHQF